MPSLHIEGRRWFQRSYGSTYHTAHIFIDGECVHVTPEEYGYGDHYLSTALDWLEANGHIAERHRGRNGSAKPCGTLFVRETLGASYSVIDVARERDLT